MSAIEAITNQVMVLGGGLIASEGRPLTLSAASEQRADAIGMHYRQHVQEFLGRDAMILCTGGASTIYDGLRNVSAAEAEGTQVADRLMNKWGVRAGIIETETGSDTTTMNVVESIRNGYISPSDYDEEHPLSVGTHINHFVRAKADLMLAGFAADAIVGIHPGVRDGAVKEFAARRIRQLFFRGVPRGDLDEMSRRSEMVTSVFGRA